MKRFKLMSVGRAEAINKEKKDLKPNKEKKVNELNKKIKDLNNMDIVDYLNHTKKEFQKNKKKKEINDDESTIDDSINKILRIKKYEEEFNGINYEIEF